VITFGPEAAGMLPQVLPTRASSRVARLLGIKAAPFRQIAFQFDELSPATKGTGLTCAGKPYVVEAENGAPNSGTHYRDCDRGGVPKAAIGELVALRGDGCLLRRDLCGSASCVAEKK
jgi:hypothetical protein